MMLQSGCSEVTVCSELQGVAAQTHARVCSEVAGWLQYGCRMLQCGCSALQWAAVCCSANSRKGV